MEQNDNNKAPVNDNTAFPVGSLAGAILYGTGISMMALQNDTTFRGSGGGLMFIGIGIFAAFGSLLFHTLNAVEAQAAIKEERPLLSKIFARAAQGAAVVGAASLVVGLGSLASTPGLAIMIYGSCFPVLAGGALNLMSYATRGKPPSPAP
jgi:hypothetical protein